jgi:hypothetical protein
MMKTKSAMAKYLSDIKFNQWPLDGLQEDINNFFKAWMVAWSEAALLQLEVPT